MEIINRTGEETLKSEKKNADRIRTVTESPEIIYRSAHEVEYQQ